MTLRSIPSVKTNDTVRSTGRVRFAQSGVEGRFVSVAAGDDRLRVDIDLDRIGQIQVALNKERGWAAVTGGPLTELAGKELRQMHLGHPSVIFGDWRKHYDAVRVLRAGQIDGRKIYVVQLESAGLPSTVVSVDAETGDVLQIQRSLMDAASATPMTTTFADYRDVGGMRVPYRSVETSEMTGRKIYEVERVEIGVELNPDVFSLQPRIDCANPSAAVNAACRPARSVSSPSKR